MGNVNAKKQDKKCFIITPIGDASSNTFRKARGVIDSVIKPILSRHGFTDVKPAYEIMESGMIGNQIINRIVNDDLVIANLTGNNPNVMYELAIRHATAKPIIHICEKGTTLPFDIKDNRTAFYTDDMLGVQELGKEIEIYVTNLDYSREYKDNPIYTGIEMAGIFKQMNSDGRSTEAELLQKILDIVSSINKSSSDIVSSNNKSPSDIVRKTNISKIYKATLPPNTDFIVSFIEYETNKKTLFVEELKNEMSKINVEFIGERTSGLCWENNGKTTFDEINNIINSIAKKHNIRITIYKSM